MKRRSFGTVRTAALAALVLVVAGCSQMPELPFGLGGGSWTSLIDGEKGLENFNRVGDANWRGEDGAIVADKGKAGFLVTKDSYRDFQLRAEFWADHTTNSGIFMRCADRNKITDKSCYEANIFDQRKDPTYGTGGIVHFVEVNPMPKAGGKWNTFEITAKGRQITVVLNGQKTAELNNGLFAEGPFTLQHGAGVIKFRKVAIKPL